MLHPQLSLRPRRHRAVAIRRPRVLALFVIVAALAVLAGSASVKPAFALGCDINSASWGPSTVQAEASVPANCSGYIYNLCLEAASEQSGYGSPFACSGWSGSSSSPYWLETARGSCTTAVFYRVVVAENGGSFRVLSTPAARTFC